MSDTNETNTPSDFSKAGTIIRSYTNVIEDIGVDGAYSWVFEYYTHPVEWIPQARNS